MELAFLKKNIINIINNNSTLAGKLQAICDILEAQIGHYDWVGFYFKNGDKNELKLAQFAGEPTEHQIIPFGKGICGQVAMRNENFGQIDVDSHTLNPFKPEDEELLEFVCKQVANLNIMTLV